MSVSPHPQTAHFPAVLKPEKLRTKYTEWFCVRIRDLGRSTASRGLAEKVSATPDLWRYLNISQFGDEKSIKPTQKYYKKDLGSAPSFSHDPGSVMASEGRQNRKCLICEALGALSFTPLGTLQSHCRSAERILQPHLQRCLENCHCIPPLVPSSALSSRGTLNSIFSCQPVTSWLPNWRLAINGHQSNS